MTEVVWSCTIIQNNSGAIRESAVFFNLRSMQHQLLWSKKKKTMLEMYTHNKSKGEH